MDCCRLLLLICLLVIFGCAEKDCEMSTVRVDGVDFPVKVVDIPYQLKYRNEVKGNWDNELRDSDDGEVRPFGMVCGRNATFNVQGELSIRVDVDGYELVNWIASFFYTLCRNGCEIYQSKIGTHFEVGTRVRLLDPDGQFFALGEVQEFEEGTAIKAIKLFRI